MNEGIVRNLRLSADKRERTHPIIGVGELRVHEALRDAARCIEETSAKIPAWIDAKDNPPEAWKGADGTLVNYLVYTPEYGVDIGNYVLSAKTWVSMGIPANVTHYMPLPTEPNLHVS